MMKEAGTSLVRSKIDNKSMMICNLYGPNKDSPGFYHQLIEKTMREYKNGDKIYLGDFNTTINPALDKMQSTVNSNPNAATALTGDL